MSVIERKRGEYHLNFRPFGGKTKTIGIKLPEGTGKKEAERIEAAICGACQSADYRYLDSVPGARMTCIRVFRNQRWEFPPGLVPGHAEPREILTLWDACKMSLSHADVRDAKGRWRYETCLVNLAEKLGRDTPLADLGEPELAEYRSRRLVEGRSPETVNKEVWAFSKMFEIMRKMKRVQGNNPGRELKALSTENSEREAYLSRPHVELIVGKCPEWFRPIVWTAYLGGLRLGEIVGLERRQIDLDERMIYLGAASTKENHKKRCPIHRDLVPILEAVLRAPRLLGNEKVFVVRDANGVRLPGTDTIDNPWPRACEALGIFQDPPGQPRFHDLRHCFIINCAESGVPEGIISMITGHADRKKSVHRRYRGRESFRLLRETIDQVTFDHGETRIFVGGMPYPVKSDNCVTTGKARKRKRAMCSHDPI